MTKYRVPVILATASFLFFSTGLTAMVGNYDEAIPTYGAARVLNGEIPYRDFWTIYAPAQFYALAGLFKIFGPSIRVERVYDAVLRSLLAALAFIMAMRLTSVRWALAVWLAVAVWLKYLGYYAYPNIPAVLLALSSLYLLFGFFNMDVPKMRLFASGVLAGLAVLFRHDTGFYLILAEFLVFLPFAFFHGLPKGDTEGLLKRLAMLPLFALAYLLGVVLALAPAAAYFLDAVPASVLVYDLVVFPFKVFPAVRRIPFPSIFPDLSSLTGAGGSFFKYLSQLSERWIFYFTLLALVSALIFFAFGRHRLRRKKNEDPPAAPVWSWQAGLILAFGLLSLNNLHIRSDLPHRLPSFVSAALVATTLGCRTF